MWCPILSRPSPLYINLDHNYLLQYLKGLCHQFLVLIQEAKRLVRTDGIVVKNCSASALKL